MGKEASAMLTVIPADASDDASAMFARTPAQCRQGRQHCDPFPYSCSFHGDEQYILLVEVLNI
jgi:hypothetical protein